MSFIWTAIEYRDGLTANKRHGESRSVKNGKNKGVLKGGVSHVTQWELLCVCVQKLLEGAGVAFQKEL